MPCYMTGSREGDSNLALEEARAEATKTTEMLCEALRYLESFHTNRANDVIDNVPGLRSWWNKHKKLDEQRHAQEIVKKAKEDLKKKALKKLTVEERAALGV